MYLSSGVERLPGCCSCFVPMPKGPTNQGPSKDNQRHYMPSIIEQFIWSHDIKYNVGSIICNCELFKLKNLHN